MSGDPTKADALWKRREELRTGILASARCWRDSVRLNRAEAAKDHLESLAKQVDEFELVTEAWYAEHGIKPSVGD